MKYILSVDQGTTGTRAVLFNEQLAPVASAYREHGQITPKPGWTEHDPEELLQNTVLVMREAIGAFGGRREDIVCLGVDNQGETAVAWDRYTGTPLYNAVVWHCRRSAKIAEEFRRVPGLEEYVHKATGLTIDSYFSATKYRWLLDNVPAVRAARDEGRLMLGTLDSWLIYKLSGGRSFVTDVATASRTMLLNINTLDWDERLLGEFGIARTCLGALVKNAGHMADTDPALLDGLSLPITGSIVDQQAALFGQACFEKGALKATYGTGCFVLMNAGDAPVYSENGILTTIAWQLGESAQYALEGGVYIAGAALQWLRDKLEAIETYGDVDGYALSLSGNEGVYFVPAFSGFGAPRWDDKATGMLIGVTLGTTKAHIIRATLEGIGYQVRDLIVAMEEAGGEITAVKADGGVTKSRFMMGFQADILNKTIYRKEDCEATARGTAMIAGLGAGVFASLSELNALDGAAEAFFPAMDTAQRARLLCRWAAAAQRAAGWNETEE